VTSNFAGPNTSPPCAKRSSTFAPAIFFQVVLSQRFSAKTLAEPFEVYRELRALNPSPYLFYLQLNDVSIVGSSPENARQSSGTRCFLPAHRRHPLARQGRGEDQRLEREMLASEKERAEHIMLVDLGRNDLGRVCDYGTVKPEKFAHRRALFARHASGFQPACRLREDVDCFDALMACFRPARSPARPKFRAMEIIEELERTRRGIYAGGILSSISRATSIPASRFVLWS